MSLQDQLNSDLEAAMKAHDKTTLNVVRMIKTSMTNEKIKAGHDLNSEEELAVLAREMKQRKESADEYAKGGRQDLVDQNHDEMVVIEKYLPAQLSDEELTQMIADAISKVGAQSTSDFGKVMGVIMPQVKGRADGAKVNEIVKKSLNN